MPYYSKKDLERLARKQSRKETGKKQGESAEDSQPHAASLVSPGGSAEGSQPHAAGVDISETFSDGQPSSADSSPQIPTLESLNINSEVPASKDDKGVESGGEESNPKLGARSGRSMRGLSEQSAASSYTEDSATEHVFKVHSISFLVEAKAKLERNMKAVETLSMLGKPANDSGEEASPGPDADVTEWVEGEKDGYHYRVPKAFHEEGERMDYFELLNDISIRTRRIAKKLQQNRKAMHTMERWSSELFQPKFVPPDCFVSDSESDCDST